MKLPEEVCVTNRNKKRNRKAKERRNREHQRIINESIRNEQEFLNSLVEETHTGQVYKNFSEDPPIRAPKIESERTSSSEQCIEFEYEIVENQHSEEKSFFRKIIGNIFFFL
jgi:hypothetical protein